jgi:hypothetical protein
MIELVQHALQPKVGLTRSTFLSLAAARSRPGRGKAAGLLLQGIPRNARDRQFGAALRHLEKCPGGSRLRKQPAQLSSEPNALDKARHLRQVHLYSVVPGRTVWAQSRQTNRPSLWAIIGLKSMPAMQYRHRMVKIVSVGFGRSCT